ncbi:MAG: hypothetical protein L6Q95_07580 [Planctomycetes bacterium]|nr:hypothetical protein [Planctomycetota bacterium]
MRADGPRTGRLVAASAAMVLLVAGAVWLELRLWDAAGSDDSPLWLRVVVWLSAWLFVPSLVLGAALALHARRGSRRTRGGADADAP